MGLSNSTFTYKHIHWRAPSPDRTPLPTSGLPENISRFYIPTPSGKIEILYAKPSSPSPSSGNVSPKTPIFFAHGGMGCAAYWLEYMTYLSARGIPCYAVSYRGHGNSWYPSFLRMVYGTTKRMLADDLLAGLRFAQEKEAGAEVVLVGHSSGGGLSQFVLSEQGDVRVKALVLAAAVPGFGSTGVYMNWFRLDPWFSFRMIFHGWHPNSPLSHPKLVRGVFFGDEQTDEYIDEFHRLGSPYESFWWPLGMGYKFVDPLRVLRSISGWGTGNRNAKQDRVLILAGGGDKIMTHGEMVKLAGFYRGAWRGLAEEKKIDTDISPEAEAVVAIPGEGGLDTSGQGVRHVVIPGAGHHLQNDVQWEIGARKLLEFYEQL